MLLRFATLARGVRNFVAGDTLLTARGTILVRVTPLDHNFADNHIPGVVQQGGISLEHDFNLTLHITDDCIVITLIVILEVCVCVCTPSLFWGSLCFSH